MNGTFSEIIQGSWEWTKTILFKPFRFKKWVFLAIIALFSAEISGFNFNINLQLKQHKGEIVHSAGSRVQSSDEISVSEKITKGFAHKNIPFIISIIAAVGSVVVLFILLWLWIYSRFSFVFLASLIRNDASVKNPFFEFKKIGNSYFNLNIVLILIIVFIIAVFVGLLAAGIVLLKDAPIFLNIILAVLWGILLVSMVLMLAGLGVIVRDLVAPVMLKNNTCFMDAWRMIIPVISAEKINFIKYFLIKLGLRIIAGILGGLAVICVMFAMIIPLGILGVLLYAVSHVVPESIQWGYYGILILLGIFSILFIILLINSILLPIPVFFRTFSLKFLARLDEKQDLFRIG